MKKVTIAALLLTLLPWAHLRAGVSRLIQDEYRNRYLNQTVFLAVPIYGGKQRLFLRDANYRLESTSEPLRFKVGEQVRVLDLSFGGDEIRFKLAAIDQSRQGELEYRFAVSLDDGFSNRSDFDAVLRQTLHQGADYSDIDKSRRDFIRLQLDSVVAELMSSTAAKREFVLDALAESLPAYREAVDDNKTLKDRNQDLTARLTTEQNKSKQLENKVVEQTSEINQLKSVTQSMRTDLQALNTSSAGINTELRQLKQQNSEIVNSVKRLQRGLGAELDASSPLSKQVEDLMVAALKTKGDRDDLDKRLKTTESDLEKRGQELQTQLKANSQLQAENKKLQDNVNLLSSRGDSLGRRYLALQKEKEQLENFVRAIQKLRAEVVEETSEGGRTRRIMEVRLNETLVGTLETDYASVIQAGEKADVRTRFAAESINFVKLTEEEKKVLGSLGDKLAIRSELQGLPQGMTARPSFDAGKATQVVAERESAEWVWQLESTRVLDANLLLLTSFVNQSQDAVPLVHNRLRIESMNLARRLGQYLSPIPLALGTLFGFVLLGIVTVLRKSARRPKAHRPQTAPTSHDRVEL